MKAILTLEDKPSNPGQESIEVTLAFDPPVDPKETATLSLYLSRFAMEGIAKELARLKKAEV